MKYTPEITTKLILDYEAGVPVSSLAEELGVSEKSIRAKLAIAGVYKRKEYTNKRGERPVRKEFYIESIANKLDIDLTLLDSLEKVTKTVLMLIDRQISAKLH